MKLTIFKENGLQALFGVIQRIKGAADNNTSAVSNLGRDLVGLADQTRAALEGKQDKAAAVTFTLPVTGWGQDETAGYPHYYDFAVPGVTAKDRAVVTIVPASITGAAACGLCPASETLEEVVRLRAASVPETEISGVSEDELNKVKAAAETAKEDAANALKAAGTAVRAAEEARTVAEAANARMALFELMYNNEVSGNPFTATFEDLSKLRIEGVWNAAQNRIEF